MIDPHFAIAIVALLCIAVAVIAYQVGHSHGRQAGRIDGLTEARGIWVPKIIKATGRGVRIGRELRPTRRLSTDQS